MSKLFILLPENRLIVRCSAALLFGSTLHLGTVPSPAWHKRCKFLRMASTLSVLFIAVFGCVASADVAETRLVQALARWELDHPGYLDRAASINKPPLDLLASAMAGTYSKRAHGIQEIVLKIREDPFYGTDEDINRLSRRDKMIIAASVTDDRALKKLGLTSEMRDAAYDIFHPESEFRNEWDGNIDRYVEALHILSLPFEEILQVDAISRAIMLDQFTLLNPESKEKVSSLELENVVIITEGELHEAFKSRENLGGTLLGLYSLAKFTHKSAEFYQMILEMLKGKDFAAIKAVLYFFKHSYVRISSESWQALADLIRINHPELKRPIQEFLRARDDWPDVIWELIPRFTGSRDQRAQHQFLRSLWRLNKESKPRCGPALSTDL